MTRYSIFCVLLLLILQTGCINDKQPVSDSETEPIDTLLGGDTDSHGCIPSAGYSWCEAKQKCLRTWEEPCNENMEASSLQVYRNEALGFSLKFPQSWEGFKANEGKYSTYRYVSFSFSGEHRPFEIFKIVQYSNKEWDTIELKIPFVILDKTIDPPLVCDGCCIVDGDTSGGGQFDIFQQKRCEEVPEILSTFESLRK